MKPGDLVSVNGVAPVYDYVGDGATYLGTLKKVSIGIFLDSVDYGELTYYMIITPKWGPVWVPWYWVNGI